MQIFIRKNSSDIISQFCLNPLTVDDNIKNWNTIDISYNTDENWLYFIVNIYKEMFQITSEDDQLLEALNNSVIPAYYKRIKELYPTIGSQITTLNVQECHIHQYWNAKLSLLQIQQLENERQYNQMLLNEYLRASTKEISDYIINNIQGINIPIVVTLDLNKMNQNLKFIQIIKQLNDNILTEVTLELTEKPKFSYIESKIKQWYETYLSTKISPL